MIEACLKLIKTPQKMRLTDSGKKTQVSLKTLYAHLGYWLDDRRSIPSRSSEGNVSLRHRVLTGSGAHPASYPIRNGSSYPGRKVAET
jgi:hypothetical protein